jgi:hypothetical protein
VKGLQLAAGRRLPHRSCCIEIMWRELWWHWQLADPLHVTVWYARILQHLRCTARSMHSQSLCGMVQKQAKADTVAAELQIVIA